MSMSCRTISAPLRRLRRRCEDTFQVSRQLHEAYILLFPSFNLLGGYYTIFLIRKATQFGQISHFCSVRFFTTIRSYFNFLFRQVPIFHQDIFLIYLHPIVRLRHPLMGGGALSGGRGMREWKRRRHLRLISAREAHRKGLCSRNICPPGRMRKDARHRQAPSAPKAFCHISVSAPCRRLRPPHRAGFRAVV